MKRLKEIQTTNKHSIKSSVSLTRHSLEKVQELLSDFNSRSNSNGAESKRMNCSANWLMLRLCKTTRILIRIDSSPQEIWVIPRRELEKACKAIKSKKLN